MKTPVLLVCALLPLAAAADYDASLDQQVSREAPPQARQAEQEQTDEFDAGRWSLEHQDLGGGRHLLRLKLDRVHTGGDGDARMLVLRWAEERARKERMAGFDLLRLEEGVRSGWFFGQRYAEAEIHFYSSAGFGRF